MLTNFNQNNSGKRRLRDEERKDNQVGTISVLRNNTKNFEHIYKDIFGYYKKI